MPRLATPLNDSKIQAAITDTKAKTKQLTDGGSGGLYLKLRANKEGQAQWRFDFKSPVEPFKRDTLIFGFYGKETAGLMTLAMARDKARDAQRMIRDGVCPGAARKGAKEGRKEAQAGRKMIAKGEAAPGTFKAVAEDFHASRYQETPAPGFKNKVGDDHAAKWASMMKVYVYPLIGNKPIASITRADVLSVLRPIEQAGKKQVHLNVHTFVSKVFKVARASDLCTGNPVEDLRELGMIGKKPKSKPLRSQTTEKGAKLIITAIDQSLDETKRDCLNMMAWAWQRPGNVRGMEWAHLDLDAATWTIPAALLKASIEEKETGEDHVVPLPKQAVRMLRKRLKARDGDCGWVFPAAMSAGCISKQTISLELGRLKIRALMTSHGFRAMARTMLREVHGFQRDALEAHLAHSNGEANGESYDRATHLDERTQAVQVWADYLDGLRGSNVKKLPVRKALPRAA